MRFTYKPRTPLEEAAPELLAALRHIVEVTGEHPDEAGAVRWARGIARVAIAKAEREG